MSSTETRVADLVQQLRELGVKPGSVLLVHTSFRAVRPVEDGPAGLIRALQSAVSSAGTLVMPTTTSGTERFDPRRTPVDGMGITADLFWRQDGVVRSTHPGASFAARGPHAEFICSAHPLSPPHGPDSPVGRVHDLDGDVLLLGVKHSENTTLHLAESIAGVPYSVSHPCVVIVDGATRTVMIPETDHCCRRFALADEWLDAAGHQRHGRVGGAQARLARSRDIVSAATARLASDPVIFLCSPSEGCGECDRARASIRRVS
jgi:aminoglycoside 3-N-acetyltransferase